jgi:hypothetical protein
MYIVEKPPWNDLRSESHSRSTSEETLRLPRMGSRDDFGGELSERAQREREWKRVERERELRSYQERARAAENGMERDEQKEMGRRWRKEGSIRR